MNNTTIVSLKYVDDLTMQYQSLSDLPGFVLLESTDRQRGRYDIVSALPYDSFTLLRDALNVKEAFEQLQRMLPTTPSACDLPFQGGAIGYVAYDFGEILAGIHSTPHPCNDMPLIDMRFYDWAIVVDHKMKQVTLVVANSQPDTAMHMNEILARWENPSTIYQPFYLRQAFAPIISQNDYRQAFDDIYQALLSGRSYQVNYTQPFLGRYSGDSWEMYKQIRLTNPVPYSSFMRCTSGDILSFSPEQFICMDNGLVQTSPIKGTAKRSANTAEDEQLKASLLTCKKNQTENVMIVDLLRNDLGKFATPGTVKVKSLCEVQSFSAVHHLVSIIEAQYPDTVTPLRVFADCFPGGSVTGVPKREAMRIINETERYSRGVYCGSIAYFSMHGRLDSNIAIRTVVAKEDSLYLSAGGAIVVDSKWEDEYRECSTKISAIVNEL